MTNAVAALTPNGGDIIESVIAKGDLSKLTPQERTRYYVEVCKSVGLNPLTKPFEYITLNNKLTLYALRNCTDQLRTIHGVSVDDLTETERDGVVVVTCKVRNKDGRTDMAKGAVAIANLKGEALANAIMKAETKAKRRATLSICGLGFLDETEVETIPNAAPPRPTLAAPAGNGRDATSTAASRTQSDIGSAADPDEALPPHALPGNLADYNPVQWGGQFIAAVRTATSQAEIDAWIEQNGGILDDIKANFSKAWRSIDAAMAAARAALGPDPEPEMLGVDEAESVLR